VREPPTFVARWLSTAGRAALALALVECGSLAWRIAAARTPWIMASVFLASAAAVWVLALPLAAGACVRPVRATWVRMAIAGVGVAIALVAFRIDAGAYVRLYGAYHGALGFVSVLGVTVACAMLPSQRRWVPSLAAGGFTLVAGFAAMQLRHDARAFAAQRGVLLADAFWATHAYARSLPAMPRHASALDAPVAPAPTRPQLILLLTIDALRADIARAPALNALAAIRENSVSFTGARAPAAWTVPSAYAMLTSRGPWSVQWTRTQFYGDRPLPYSGTDDNPRRVWPLPMRDRAPTLPEALRAAGYETRVCTTLPFQVPRGGLVRGFDVVEQGVYHRRNLDLRGVTSDMLTGCGLAMIQAARGRPLFLWLHYSDPHEPYASHPEAPARDDTPLARYAGEVAFVNRHLAALLLNVDRMVGLGRTLVVLTADHGEEFGEHGGEFHAVTLYDEIARVPLMIAMPGFPSRAVGGNVSLLDVAPTILDLVGAPPLPRAEGRSLARAMRGEPLASRRVFGESIRYGRAVRMVVDGDFKLIYEARARTYELFNLRNDPGEQRNIADQRRDVLTRLAAAMGVPAP